MRTHKLQTILQNAADNFCLAITYLYLVLHHDADDTEKGMLEPAVASMLVMAANDEEVLDEDGFVKDAEKLIFRCTGKKVSVTKNDDITSVKELPKDTYSAVRFDYNNKSHWVGFLGDKFLYNSLDFSNCFSYGKPTAARILKFN